jgi:transketolase
VQLCLGAYEQLAKDGIRSRVVSMPCWELFERQTPEYRESVLPKAITARVAVEQASTFGWERYVGMAGVTIGMTTFGASAPLPALAKHFGFTIDHVVQAAHAQVGR